MSNDAFKPKGPIAIAMAKKLRIPLVKLDVARVPNDSWHGKPRRRVFRVATTLDGKTHDID